VKIAVYGYTRPADATGLSDAYSAWRSAEIGSSDWVRFDPDRAGKLLDEAGYPKSSEGARVGPDHAPLRFVLNTVAAWPDWARAAEVVADGLRGLGIEVTVRATEFGVYFDDLQRGKYQLSLGWTAEGPNPYHFYRSLMSPRMLRPIGEISPENWGRFESDTADALLSGFERTADPSEQQALVDAMQRTFASAAPVVPLYSAVSWSEFSTRWFEGFPDENDPYAKPAPYATPECLLVLSRIQRRDTEARR
jgi:peptide/nickel transport system substrate-binding protein